MAQVGSMHCGLAGSGKLGEDAAQKRAAHVQCAAVRFRKGNSGKVQGRQPGLRNGQGAQILGHQRALLQLAAGFGQALAQLCELFKPDKIRAMVHRVANMVPVRHALS